MTKSPCPMAQDPLGTGGIRDDATFPGVQKSLKDTPVPGSKAPGPGHAEMLAGISILALEARDMHRFKSECLAELGKRMPVSRAYIFQYRPETGAVLNTHEWCAPGIGPQRVRWQDSPTHSAGWWLNILDNDRGDSLRAPDALSVLASPIFVDGSYFGFIGVDDCVEHRVWSGEDTDALRTTARILGSLLERFDREERVQAERSQLLSIFDSMDEPAYVADPTSFEVLFVNRVMRHLLGKDPVGGLCHAELYGQDHPCSFCTNKLILDKRGETYRWEHDSSLLGGMVALHDRIIEWPDGREVRLEMAFDITQQKRLEEQLRAAQRMEAVGQLAGGVAHDFNNLLCVVLNCASLMLEDLPEGDPLRLDAQEIKKAGERAVSLTGQLLAFSRKQVMEPRVLDLNETVADMEPMLRRLMGEDIELVKELSPELGRVKADPSQIEQVIMNLVVNARDAMPTGGRVAIATTNEDPGVRYAEEPVWIAPGPYVLLSISDTGCGMDEAVRKRVFEPFFTTKELGKGTGLGLSTVYGIVKQSSGYIWVSSEPGRGSTFNVYLPRVEDEAEPTSVKREEKAVGGMETILVVEDDDQVREVSARMLRAAGYSVLTGSDGGEAMQLCAEHPGEIHLLLTDMVMPGITGRELAHQMREVRPGLPVLFMTGYLPGNGGSHRELGPGAMFLHKPFDGEELRGKVRQALGSRPAGE